MENAKNVGPRVKLAVRTYIGADVRNYVLNDKQASMVAKENRACTKKSERLAAKVPAVP